MLHLLTPLNVILAIVAVVFMIVAIKHNIIRDSLKSLNNKEEGFSGRKMVALTFSLLAVYVHIAGFQRSFIDKENIVTVLLIDIITVLLALSLIKVDDILRFKNGNSPAEKKEENNNQ